MRCNRDNILIPRALHPRRDGGQHANATGPVTLSAADAWQVGRVDVRQGERISAGQTLTAFDNPLDSATLGNALAFITSEFNTGRTDLLQDLATQRWLSARRAVSLRTSIASLRAQLTQISRQLKM